MARSLWLLLSVVSLVVASAACGAGDNDSESRARNPSNVQSNQAIAPTGNFGTTPHDMPGGSRWSNSPKGK